jgi:hypothetical protein
MSGGNPLGGANACCFDVSGGDPYPPASAGLALDGKPIGPLSFGQGNSYDYLDIKRDTPSSGSPSPTTGQTAPPGCWVVPSGGTYTVVVFVWERDTGIAYDLALYRSVLDTLAGSTLVGTISRSAATATVPGATSTAHDVAMFTFPATAFSTADICTATWQITNGAGAPANNWGGLIVVEGASL